MSLRLPPYRGQKIHFRYLLYIQTEFQFDTIAGMYRGKMLIPLGLLGGFEMDSVHPQEKNKVAALLVTVVDLTPLHQHAWLKTLRFGGFWFKTEQKAPLFRLEKLTGFVYCCTFRTGTVTRSWRRMRWCFFSCAQPLVLGTAQLCHCRKKKKKKKKKTCALQFLQPLLLGTAQLCHCRKNMRMRWCFFFIRATACFGRRESTKQAAVNARGKTG